MFLYSLGQNITTRIIAHRPSRHQSMCDICFVFYWPEITTCIIAHRPSRHQCRCAIAVFVLSWPENHNMHHRTSTESTPVDVRYLFLYSLGQKITTFTIAHRPSRHPCGKQHFREIATPDWVMTLRRCENTR